MHAQSFARIRVYGDFQQIAARKFPSYLNNRDETIYRLFDMREAIKEELWNLLVRVRQILSRFRDKLSKRSTGI